VRALVTGVAGFIGSHIARRLIAEGEEVVGLDSLLAGSLDNIADLHDLRFIEGDLRDEHVVRKAADGCGLIFHQGAMRSVPLSVRKPTETTDVNVRGTLNVLLAARESSARVVFASSSSIYGDQDRFPVKEDVELRPRSPYAASKLAGEAYCAAWWETFGTPSVSLRYFNAYGPGQDPASEYAAVIPRFIQACLNGERPTVYGDGHQARDFTYIDDVVEANLLAARAPEAAFGRAFNIGGGQVPTTVNRLLELIASATGTRPDPVHEPPRPGDLRKSQADISLANQIFGYQPAVRIEEGLRRTIHWFRSSR
jgi:UDP-glucose 4-epimerase